MLLSNSDSPQPWYLAASRFLKASAALGISGRCLPVHAAYEVIRQWVELAKHRILVVNNFQHDWSESEDFDAKRRLYFAALMNAAERGIPYNRVVQLKPDAQLYEALERRPLLRRHLEAMLQVRRAHRHPQTALKQCTIQSDLDFVLVDESVAIQIRYFDRKSNQFVQGDYLLLRDGSGELIESLATLFFSVDGDGSPITDRDIRIVLNQAPKKRDQGAGRRKKI